MTNSGCLTNGSDFTPVSVWRWLCFAISRTATRTEAYCLEGENTAFSLNLHVYFIQQIYIHWLFSQANTHRKNPRLSKAARAHWSLSNKASCDRKQLDALEKCASLTLNMFAEGEVPRCQCLPPPPQTEQPLVWLWSASPLPWRGFSDVGGVARRPHKGVRH